MTNVCAPAKLAPRTVHDWALRKAEELVEGVSKDAHRTGTCDGLKVFTQQLADLGGTPLGERSPRATSTSC